MRKLTAMARAEFVLNNPRIPGRGRAPNRVQEHFEAWKRERWTPSIRRRRAYC